MSGYRYSVDQNPGTGPMQINDQILKLAHKFKLCSSCDNERDPGGGIQLSATKWKCAACWRVSQRGKKL